MLHIRYWSASGRSIRPFQTAWVVLICAIVVTKCGSATAKIQPSFDLQDLAWNATDIVVAAEGAALDGRLTVTEVWAGGLQVGDTISLPELKQFASTESRTVDQQFSRGRADAPAVVVSPERMVLYLKRAEPQGTQAATGTVGINWEPAARFGGLKVSLAWLLGKETYVFFQVMNPGPSTLTNQGRTPLELKRQTNEILAARNELRRIAAIADPAARAEAAAAYVQSPVWHAKGEALKILGESGPAALPVIRRILDRESKWNAGAVQALAKAGGAQVTGELTQRLQEEIAYWKLIGPDLNPGWWNTPEFSAKSTLQARYGYMLQLLYALRDLKAAEAQAPVTELRDFWRSLPQLEDKSGLNQMSEACDDTLAAIANR